MLLKRVHLSPDHASRYPHEFSGGQRQRICIARALALEPRVIVSDESVSALDVSVRGQVLDLLLEVQEEMGLAYLLISHDMAVIERMSHDVAVMRAGESWNTEPGDGCLKTRFRSIRRPSCGLFPFLFRAAQHTGSDPCCSRSEFVAWLANSRRYLFHSFNMFLFVLGSWGNCHGQVRAVWFFLARRHFAAKPRLLTVGFPWISSSESRLINALHGIFAKKFFLALCPRRSQREMRLTILEDEGAGLCIEQP